ncbi:MAG: ribose 5-phosphate isomerase B [Bacteroidales bacterium]
MKEYIKTIGIASDHAGFTMKEAIKEYLEQRSIKVIDFGTHSLDSMDYPDVAHPLANAIEEKKFSFGIALCGSGNGISMTLNKHQGIRAALCWNKELSQLSRQHNDANILTMPARFIDKKTALEIVDAFLTTEFEGGRHLKRVNKIRCNQKVKEKN